MKYIHKFRHFLHNNMIMNWSNLNKCILILVFACAIHILWLIWKIFILFQPDLWQWVDLSILKFQIGLNILSLFFLSFLIIPCITLQRNKIANLLLPYLIINLFVLMIIRDGYLIGIFSPATLCGYICLSGIGFLLFERKFLYVPLLFATTILFLLAILTINKIIPYAPLFSLNLLNNYPFSSTFWVASMAYFSLPLLIIGLVLTEILLTQWRHREALIKKLSQTDPLTNLLNRRSFNEKLQLVHRSKSHYAIIILDLDHFKNVNDHYGHNIGDLTLQYIAEALTDQIRPHDFIARYGGEEFIIILNNTHANQAMMVAERFRQTIEKTEIPIDANQYIHITASFGICMSTPLYEYEKIIHFADQALYLAKQKGRNQVQMHQ